MDDNPPHPYTIAGRMLLLCAIVLPIGGTWITIYLLSESLPQGRYPILFFAMPFLVAAFVLFFGGSALLRKFGVRIRRDDLISEDGNVLPKVEAVEPQLATPSTAYCSNCDKDVAVDDDYRCLECHWPI